VAAQGYVAKSDEAGRTGGTRRGSWKLRVPVAKFHDFLARVEAVGELVSKSSDAQDVTEEVIDAEARLKNLKSEEGVLNKLLQEKAQSTADLLAFRQQITGVRESIERLQARLDNLTRLSAMTTVELVMWEDQPFVPDSAPTFGTTISRTFADSVGALARLGKALVLGLVGLAPWTPVLLVGVWVFRRPIRAVRGGLLRAVRGSGRPA